MRVEDLYGTTRGFLLNFNVDKTNQLVASTSDRSYLKVILK